MRVVLVLVSSDQDACDLFRKEKEGLVPRSLREHERIKSVGLKFVTGIFDPAAAQRSIQDYVLDAARSAGAVALLVDSSVAHIAVPVASACFVGNVAFNPQATNYKNLIVATLTKLIKNLVVLVEAQSSAGSQQALLLPLRNFVAPELNALQDLFRLNTISPEFPIQLGRLVGQINERKRPRRQSPYKSTYLVDDQQKLFDYGKERHAQLATGAPHNSMCVLTGNFRFGRRIPTDRHYNVTKEAGAFTRISGDFPDCHGAVVGVAETTHLNMFSNDYHT
jgi:hypothetical protein